MVCIFKKMIKKVPVPANFREVKDRKIAINMERASFETDKKYAAWGK